MFLVPLAYAIYMNANWLTDLTRRRAAVLFFLLCGAVVANFFVITHLRDGVYFKVQAKVLEPVNEQQIPNALKTALKVGKQLAGLVSYSIDPWVGIEGVMAVSAYPELGEDLLRRPISEPPVKSGPAVYTKIAPWPPSARCCVAQECWLHVHAGRSQLSILLGLVVDTLPDDGLARCGPAIFRVLGIHSDPKSAPVRQYRLVAERVDYTPWWRA
jgi:hypothetical protein